MPAPAAGRIEAHRQRARDVERVAPAAVLDLMAARGAVGQHQRIGLGLAHRRQQRELRHLERHIDRVGAIAEGAGHAAAARLHGLDRELRDEPEHRFRRAHGPERFLVAMAVQERALGHRLERQVERARRRFARQEFLEQQRVGRQRARVVAPDQRGQLVAETENAARLEPDDRHAAREQRRQRRDAAFRLAARLLDQTDREEGAPAAERTAAAVRGLRQMHAVAGGGEHAERGLDVLRLEIAVEGVGEEHDRARIVGAGHARRLAPDVAAPARQVPARAQAGIFFRPLPEPGLVVAQVGEVGPARGIRRIAREISDQPVAQREPVLGDARGLHLDLHARHVDAGGAFAPAGLAGHAELERLRHLVRGQRVGAELARDREAQRVGAAAGDVALVAGDAVARAHDAAGERAAGAVVVAHLDRALETAAGAGIGRPVEPRIDRRRRDNPARNGTGVRSSKSGACTILPGLKRSCGSKLALTSSNARTSSGPNILSWNSERTMPSPCSPECEPL